jgi:hypothetical protein
MSRPPTALTGRPGRPRPSQIPKPTPEELADSKTDDLSIFLEDQSQKQNPRAKSAARKMSRSGERLDIFLNTELGEAQKTRKQSSIQFDWQVKGRTRAESIQIFQNFLNFKVSPWARSDRQNNQNTGSGQKKEQPPALSRLQ